MPWGSLLSPLRLAQGETASWTGPCNACLEDYQPDMPRKPCGLAQEAIQFPEIRESPDHPNLWRLRYEVHGEISRNEFFVFDYEGVSSPAKLHVWAEFPSIIFGKHF